MTFLQLYLDQHTEKERDKCYYYFLQFTIFSCHTMYWRDLDLISFPLSQGSLGSRFYIMFPFNEMKWEDEDLSCLLLYTYIHTHTKIYYFEMKRKEKWEKMVRRCVCTCIRKVKSDEAFLLSEDIRIFLLQFQGRESVWVIWEGGKGVSCHRE